VDCQPRPAAGVKQLIINLPQTGGDGGGELNYQEIAYIIGRLGKSDGEGLCGPTETSVCETAKVTQGQHTHRRHCLVINHGPGVDMVSIIL
jgi:hypothetical protein